MPPSPLTMAGPAPSGKSTQPNKPPPIDHTTPLPLNGIHQRNNKQRFNTHCTFGTHAKPGTSSYAETCTKTPTPRVITQQTHHDDTPYHIKNLPNIQKIQLSSKNQKLLSYSKSTPHTKPPARPSSYPRPPTDQNLNDQSNAPINSLFIPYRPHKMMTNNNSTSLAPPGTLTQPSTTTQTTPQQIHKRYWLPRLNVKPYHASATHNTINIPPQPPSQAHTPATNNMHMTPPISQPAAITQPSSPHMTAFNGTRPPKLKPISRPTGYSTNTHQPDPTTRSIHSNTSNHPPTFQCNPSMDAITNPTLISQHPNCQSSPATAPPQDPRCEHTSVLLKDHPHSMALKEIALSLNEKLNRLFSISASLSTSSVHRYTTTKNSPSKIDPTMHDTPHSTHPKHDTLPTQNLSDLYELMSALLPTINDPINHLNEHTLLTALLSHPKNSQETTYSSTYSGNLSAKSSYYNNGTPYKLLENLPQPPYSKDLRKPP